MKRNLAARMQMLSVVPLVLAAGMVSADDVSESTPLGVTSPVRNGTIGYAMATRHWAVYESKDEKTDCPHGFNGGPREQYKILFPDDGTERTVLETQLMREGRQWHPSTSPERFPYYEVQGKVSYGLNLDAKVSPDDFENPEGGQGIDNQLYRAIGCIANYRSKGTIYHFEDLFMRQYNNNRILIELTGVDSLANDDSVELTIYRGLDFLLTDATGKAFIPGGTERADMRWGERYTQQFKGKIVDGVLTTEPANMVMVPWSSTFATSGYQLFRSMRFSLKLTPQDAKGLMAGYVDIDHFIHQLNTQWSTHHQSYGQQSSPSQYRAMRRLADGYPDSKTGANTAISSAAIVEFTQVFIRHPSQETTQVMTRSSHD